MADTSNATDRPFHRSNKPQGNANSKGTKHRSAPRSRHVRFCMGLGFATVSDVACPSSLIPIPTTAIATTHLRLATANLDSRGSPDGRR